MIFIFAGRYGTTFMTSAAALLGAGPGYAAENYERITGKAFDPEDREAVRWAAGVFEPLPPLSAQHPLSHSNSPFGYAMTTETARPKEVIGAGQVFSADIDEQTPVFSNLIKNTPFRGIFHKLGC